MDAAYVLDKDGTLTHESVRIRGASDFVRHVQERARAYVILSNTGTRTGAQVAEELTRTLGVHIPHGHVITARDQLLEAVAETSGRVVVVDDATAVPMPDCDDASDVRVAVMTDGCVTAATLAHVAEWVRRGAALWITSTDMSVMRRTDGGALLAFPGPGVVLKTVECLAPVGALRVFGKGSSADASLGASVLARLRAQGYHGATRSIVMVGDRIDTDVRMGRSNGWSTCLVETGCHRACDMWRFPQEPVDTVAANVYDLTADGVASEECGVTRGIRSMVQRLSLFAARPPRRIQSAPELSRMG